MSRKLLLAAISPAVFVVGPSLLGLDIAQAQSATGQQPTAGQQGDNASNPNEVVVVARRTAEQIQKVPLTVTAISGRQLREQTITTGTDIQKLVPSLSVGISIFGPAQQYSLRGIRDGVVEYFNDVPVDSILADSQLFDLSSIQAVSGPQGTLFGRNSTGGDVLFVPQKPTGNFEGFAQIRYGSYNLIEPTMVVNLPVNDKLKLRVDFQLTKQDGITKNLSGNDLEARDHKNFRFSVLYTPTSWFSDYAVLALAYRNDTPVAQVSGIAGNELTVDNSLPGQTYGFYEFMHPALYNNDPEIYYHDLLEQQNRGIRTVDIPINSAQDNNLFQFSNVMTADVGPVTLKYITGYQGSYNHQLISDLSIPLPVIIGQNDDTTGMLTQEWQVMGRSFNDRLNWVAGVYFADSWTNSKASYLLFAPVGTPLNNLTTQQSGGPVNQVYSLAEYAQGTLALTDALKLTVGLRYTQDHLNTEQIGFFPGQICDLPVNGVGVNLATCLQTLSTQSGALTYNFTLDYQAAKGLLLYATTRRGYNQGGFNPGFPPPVPSTVQPEYITDYEAGLKADGHIGSVPVRVAMSAYLSKYSNIQRSVGEIFTINNKPTVITAFLNAASATIYGAEIEVMAQPVEGLTLQGSYGYLHTQYDQFVSFLGSATGNKFAQAPEHTVHVSATYRHPLPTGELVANVSYSYISDVNFADINIGEPGNNAPGYGLVDLRLDWNNIGGHHIDVGVYVKNATNAVYKLNASDNTALFGFVSTQYGDPRTVGVEARYSFGG